MKKALLCLIKNPHIVNPRKDLVNLELVPVLFQQLRVFVNALHHTSPQSFGHLSHTLGGEVSMGVDK